MAGSLITADQLLHHPFFLAAGLTASISTISTGEELALSRDGAASADTSATAFLALGRFLCLGGGFGLGCLLFRLRLGCLIAGIIRRLICFS